MSERISIAEQRAAGGLAGLGASATGRSLRAVAEDAFAGAGKRKAEPEARKAGARKAKAPKPLVAQFVERKANEGEIVFVLPLPPIQASPNWRGYWMAKGKAIKAYRQQCGVLMRQSGYEPFECRVVIDLEFYQCRVVNDKKSCYSKDEDNARASMKAAQDALKDAGIIPGDGKKFVRVGKTTLYTRAKEHKGFTCAVMTLRKEDENANS